MMLPDSQLHNPQKLPLIRNRNVSPQEQASLEEERALNKSLLAYLEKEMEMRCNRARDASVNTQLKATQCKEAVIRHDAAKHLVDTLSGINSTVYYSIKQLQNTHNRCNRLGSGAANSDVSGLTEIEEQWHSCATFLSAQLNKATLALRLATEAVARSLDEQQDALGREEQCNATVESTRNHVLNLKSIDESRSSRALLRIPDMLWREIFTAFTEEYAIVQAESSAESPHPLEFPSLKLSSVCQMWRVIANDYHMLWRDIHVKLDHSTSHHEERIKHYIYLAKHQPLRITIAIRPVANVPASEITALASVFAINHPIDSLIIKGITAGKSIVDKISHAIQPPRRLTIAFSNDQAFQRLGFTRSKAEQLEELTLRNCSPAGVLGAHPWTCTMLKLRVYNTTPEALEWDLFYERFSPLVKTLRELVLETHFSDNLAVEAASQPLPYLASIRTNLQALYLFYRAKLFTPALKFLTITLTDTVQPNDWSVYAADTQGGGNITDVAVEGSIPQGAVACASLLLLLPRLKTLKINGDAVDLVLDAMITSTASPLASSQERDPIPLKALEFLSIAECSGAGPQIVALVRRYYLSDSRKNNPLRVELRQCHDMMGDILDEILEMGAILADKE